MTENLRDEVAGVLRACGIFPVEASIYAGKLMPLLERREREAEARALREAADLLDAEDDDPAGFGWGATREAVRIIHLLRDRADAITNADTQRCHSHPDEAYTCQFSAGKHCACDTSIKGTDD